MRLIGNLINGKTNKFKIGDRVHIKNDTYSTKRGRKEVYIIDDVCYDNMGGSYRLIGENRCTRVMREGGFSDRNLIGASNAPPTPTIEEEYPWLKKSKATTKGDVDEN